jgi:hypothetical protein
MTTASSFAYIETSIPSGVTIHDYRVSRPPRRPFWRRAMKSFRPATSAGR